MTESPPPSRGAPHLRVVEVGRPGFRLALDADPVGAGTRIARHMRADLALDLDSAVDALAERVHAADHRRSLERVRRAARLQLELDSYSPEADRQLLERRPDLKAALALRPEAIEQLPAVEALVERLENDNDVLRRAEQDLAEATGALGFLLPATATQPDAVAIIRAHGDAAAAAWACFRARHAYLGIVRLHKEVVEATADTRAAGLERDRAAQALATSVAQARRLLLEAAMLTSGAVLMAGLTVSAVLPTAIGLALAFAFLPPAAERVRRRFAIRAVAEKAWLAAGARSLLAEQGRLRDEQAVRARRVEAAASLAEAKQASAEADRRWRFLVGPDAPIDDLQRILGPIETLLQRRDARDNAAKVRDARVTALASALDQTGIVCGRDLVATVDRLRRLLDLRPRARELLFAVSDVEQRDVERMLLDSMLGGRTIQQLQEHVRAEARGNDRALVVVDDGDQQARKRVSAELRRLDGRAEVVVVTSTPELWPIDDAKPAGPTLTPATTPATEADRPQPKADSEPDRPWFVTR